MLKHLVCVLDLLSIYITIKSEKYWKKIFYFFEISQKIHKLFQTDYFSHHCE